MHLSIVLLYAGLLGLLLLALSGQVVRLRWRYRVGLGTGSSPELERAVRAHANFCEYVPLALVLMIGLSLAGAAPGWALHALGLALLVGRLLHAFGLSRSAGASRARQAGTILTWLVLLVAAGAAVAAGVRGLAA
jgi:hypothetical protein